MFKGKKVLVYALVVLSMIFWSFSFIWYKDVYLYLQPFTTIFSRLVISAILLFAFSKLSGKLQKVKASDAKFFLLLAFFEPFLYFIGESLGMQFVTPTTAAVIIALIPLLVPVLAYFLLNERLLIKNVVGIGISFSGVLLVITNSNLEFNASLKGVLLMCLAVCGAVFYTIVLKKLTSKYNPFTLISWQNAIGAAMFLPLVLIYDVQGWNASMLSVNAFIPVLKLAVFASSVAFLCYTYGIQVLGAVKSNIFTNLIPVITAVLSFFLLNEKLLLHNWIGITIVIGGLVLSQINSMRKSR